MKKTLAVVCAMMVLFIAAIGMGAAKPTVEEYKGVSASAEFMNTTVSGVVTDTYVSVASDNTGTYVYMTVYKYDNNGYFDSTFGQKYFAPGSDVFSSNMKLDSAILTVSGMEMGKYVCDPVTYDCEYVITGTSDINVEWTGIGETTGVKQKYAVKSGNFLMRFSGKSLYVQAEANANIDGVSSSAIWADMNAYSSVTTTKVK